MTMTPKKKHLLDFVNDYEKRRGFAPSIPEIARKLKRAPSTIHQHLEELRKSGHISREKNQRRSVKIQEKEAMITVPLLGTVAAGRPIHIFTDQEKEIIAVPKNKLPKSGDVYALRVQGESMIDEGINDGDTILVKKQQTAVNGQLVIALLGDNEATLKKIYKERGQVRLQPANKNFEPIIVKNGDIKIQGVLFDIVRAAPRTESSTLGNIKTLAPIVGKKMPLNQVVLGDVINEIKKIPDESIDIVIADPPYNIGKDFGNNKDRRELTDYVAWSKEWLNECVRTLKPNGTLFIYGFSEILAHLSVEISLPKRWLIWHYTNKNVASANFWQRSHEAIICVWKEKPIFNKDAVREAYTEGFLNGAAGKERAGTVGRFSKSGKTTIYKAHPAGALPRDVIKIPALAGGAGMNERWFFCKDCDDIYAPRELKRHSAHKIEKHPTQKPLELTKKLIQSAEPKKRGVILVPFAGTGSECVAAKSLHHDFIGYEINPNYVRMARKWLSTL